MNVHYVKCVQPWFDYCCSGLKTFEVRKNDRDYRKGDILILKEYDLVAVENGGMAEYTGREKSFEITLVLYDEDVKGIQTGYCVMGIKAIEA